MRIREGNKLVVVALMAFGLMVAGLVPAGAQSEVAVAPADGRTVEDMVEAYHRPLQRSLPTAAPDRSFAAIERSQPTVEGSLLVTTAGDAAAWLADVGDLPGAVDAVRIADRVVQVAVASDETADRAAEIAALDGVVSVDPDVIRQVNAVPDDPDYAIQWQHQMTDVERAWDVRTDGAGVRLAILDSGIDARNPELGSMVVDQVRAAEGVLQPGSSPDNDTCLAGHGTAVAGSAAALGNNGQGIAGVLWGGVELIDVEVTLAPQCGIPDAAMIAGLDYIASLPNPPAVANMSFGGPSTACPTAVDAAVQQARAADIFLVASSGNNQENQPDVPSTPASCNGVFSVGATGADAVSASYSTQNQWVDLTAPGGDFLDVGNPADVNEVAANQFVTTCRTSGGQDPYCTGLVTLIQGTSFSSPYVAGVAALLRAQFPDLSLDQVEAVLEASAADLAPAGPDAANGWGMVQVGAAFELAASGQIPPVVADPDFPVSDGGGGAPVGQVIRASAGGQTTEPITQAAAVAHGTFAPGQAQFAVLARPDDFADGLAGSAVSFGIAPILFANPPGTGSLPAPTRDALLALLPPGTTVFLMGGPVAIDAGQEQELASLGFEPVRLAGGGREETAAAAAAVVRDLIQQTGFPDLGAAIVARRDNWVDAVTAGAMASFWGIPVLLTNPDSLHPATDAAIRDLGISQILVLGGETAVGAGVFDQLSSMVGPDNILRLGSTDRVSTALLIADFTLFLQLDVAGLFPEPLILANVRRADAYAHILSASAVAGAGAGLGNGGGGFFIPVDGENGTDFRREAQEFSCFYPSLGLVLGGPDLIVPDNEALLDQVFRGEAGACAFSEAAEGFGAGAVPPEWHAFADRIRD